MNKSMQENYAAVPSSPSGPQTITTAVIEPLRATKGWARFLSILGFIVSGFMILAGLAMMLGMGAMVAGLGGSVGTQETVMLVVMGGVYILFALLYLIPSMWLFRYASRIGDLLQSQSEIDLIAALHAQKSFWKFVGIMAAIVMGIYAVIIVIAIIGAMIGGFAAQ